MTPPTSSVENRAAPAAPPMASPIFGKTYANTKTSISGCMTVRPRNIQTSLRSTARSRSNSAPNALRDEACAGLTAVMLALLTQLPPGEVDEDGLERGLLDADVLQGETLTVRVRDDLGQGRSAGA